jgi:hypothetical protein
MQQGPHGYGPPQGYPQQQQPQKQGMSTLAKVLIALLVIGVCAVGGCVVCVGVGAKAVSDAVVTAQASASAKDAAAKAAATQVEIGVLVQEYKNNEVRADEAYKGKYVVTAGRVREISKDFTDSMIVLVEPLNAKPFDFPIVACYPPESEKADAAKLNKGSLVAVKGRVDGKVVTNIIVRECALTVSKK